MNVMFYAIIAVVVILMLLIITNIRIVSQSNAFVIERLGAYHGTWNSAAACNHPRQRYDED